MIALVDFLNEDRIRGVKGTVSISRKTLEYKLYIDIKERGDNNKEILIPNESMLNDIVKDILSMKKDDDITIDCFDASRQYIGYVYVDVPRKGKVHFSFWSWNGKLLNDIYEDTDKSYSETMIRIDIFAVIREGLEK